MKVLIRFPNIKKDKVDREQEWKNDVVLEHKELDLSKYLEEY